MLSHEDNELLCRVGPGTLMGDLFRQYWLPAMQTEELPKPDCDQVRVMLLGEELIGFRDTNGKVGLVANSCPHRGASLYYARNEDCGLRCIYHGWKFDVDGNCVDMPNEPASSNFKDRVKAVAYPTIERGGIIWTYMGPREVPPPLPDLEGNMDDSSMTYSQIRNCNWMQALEGDIDTVHFSWLHVGHIQPEDAVGDFMRYQVTDRSPTYSVLDTDWGTSYATFTSANEDENHCRMASFLMPCYTMVPQGIVMANRTVRAWVPMDDDHVIWFIMAAPPLIPDNTLAVHDGVSFIALAGFAGEEMVPRTTDWFGRYRPAPDESNDYRVNRDHWREGKSFTGLTSVSMEDHAVTESMGTIYNRSKEHLGTSDAMIIRTRHRLIAAAEAFQKEGIVPPGVDEPEVYRQRSGALLLGKDQTNDWFEATKDQRAAFVDHSPEDIRASFVRN